MATLTDTRWIVVDTETTGIDYEVEKLVEVTAIELVSLDSREHHVLIDELINPGIPIPAVASAVHHLTEQHLAGKPSPEEVVARLRSRLDSIGADNYVLIAHNASFDQDFVASVDPYFYEVRWFDTRRMAKHLWPEAPKHSNQVLRYHLELNVDTVPLSPHRALADVMVTAELFRRECAAYRLCNDFIDDADAMIEFIERPLVVTTMTFGKHRGERLDEIPNSYIRWALDNIADLDFDLKWSLEQQLNNGAL
jgi:exodeoxyribonuclease X